MSESKPPSEREGMQGRQDEGGRPVMPDVSELEPVGVRRTSTKGEASEGEGGAEGRSGEAAARGGAAKGNVRAVAASAGEDIGRVLQIPLMVHVELGRRRMRISELLALGPGSVLELDAEASSPLAIYANRTLVARGEAVVVDGHYGVRITEIVSPEERALRLGGTRSGS